MMRARSWLNLGLLISGLGSTFSGLNLQLRYHMHRQPRTTTGGWDYPTWSLLHQVTSVLLLAMVLAHLWLNWKWLRGVWNKGLVPKHRQLFTLCLLFLLLTLTGLGAWWLGVLGNDLRGERQLVELHDKIALVVVVLLALHVGGRSRRLVR